MLHFGGVLTCFWWQRWYVETWISICLGGLGREVWVVAVVFVSKVRNHIERLNVAPNIQSWYSPRYAHQWGDVKAWDTSPEHVQEGFLIGLNGDISTNCDVSLYQVGEFDNFMQIRCMTYMNPPVWTYQTWKGATRPRDFPPNGGDCKGHFPQKCPKQSGIGISS